MFAKIGCSFEQGGLTVKNTIRLWMMSGVLIALCFGSIASGANLTPKQQPKSSPPQPVTLQAAPQPPSTEMGAILGQAPNLVPQPQDYPLLVAQNAASPQAVIVSDPHVQADLDRLAAEIAAIKKDTKKPDTKKAWSAPRVSGRLFLDSVNIIKQNTAATDGYDGYIQNGQGGNIQNAAGFRELRLGVAGSGYDSFDYKIELGFQGPTVVLVDNWIGAKNLPLLGYVRAGHFKPETGLYYPMSSNDISLMEYATPANVFGLGRRIGISSENTFANDRVRAFFGVFQSGATDASRVLREDNQGQVVNLRLTVAPIFAEEGKRLLHLGGHWEYVATDAGKTASINVSPAALNLYSPATLRSGVFDCDHYNRGGLEFALQNGPFSVRSEAFAGSYDAYRNSPTRNLFGAYVELGWFLTGEYRAYDLKKGGFGGVKPKKNFRPFKSGDSNLIDGFGAWQVVAQWGYTDLSDWRDMPKEAQARGGYQNDLVLGLSWFWTPQLRWVFEYVHSMQNIRLEGAHRHPTEDIFGTSVRVNF